MKIYTLKSVARRSTMLAAAVVVAGAALLPVTSASADALNPLTDRSLTLSSSAPGWDFKDGSGNETYAVPNSGANGKKTGNTFSFKVSTDSNADSSKTVKAITFQYCTTPAGTCSAPGNNGTTATTRNADDVATEKSDLNVVYADAGEVTTSVFSSTTGAITSIPNANGTEGSYIVYTKDNGAGTWTQNTGWTMAATNNEDGQDVGDTQQVTGKNNYITLTNSAGGLALKRGGEVKIVFFGTDDNYITNPGKGAFFVKINTFKDVTGRTATDLVDGGVTVANVMNLGISIQTKVLETMDFSVGTVDPYTLDTTQLSTATSAQRTTHGTCDPILNAMNPTDKKNTLLLGNESGENSLSTDVTYSTHSYFRLSSNASAGATVYYSGVTLSNTVNDKIKPIGATKKVPERGTEQFGLALANNSGTSTADPLFKVNYATERKANHLYESGADNAAAGLVALNESGTPTGTGVDTSWTPTGGQKLPQLTVYNDGSTTTALEPKADYNQGAGIVNPVDNVYDNDPTPSTVSNTGSETMFAFDDTSNQIPVAIASEGNRVVDCASAKVRYIANIAATTPAGIYTTKINFIAAPQY